MKSRASKRLVLASCGALSALFGVACEEQTVKYEEIPYPTNSSLASNFKPHPPPEAPSGTAEALPTAIAGLAVVPTAKPSGLWPTSFSPDMARPVENPPARPAPVRAAPAPALPPAVSPPPPSEVALAKPRCDPPYYYNASGTRVFKEHCL